MKRLMTVVLFVALAHAAACGSSQPKADETPAEEMTTQPTEESSADNLEMTETQAEEAEMAEDPNHLEAPPNVEAPPADATQTPSGLAYVVLTEPAEGAAQATPTSTVTAHYSGWTTDGERFDSSWERGQPATFPLTKVIAGWQEGVGSMAEGEVRRLWIPESLAYKGKAGAPAGMLVFDVELIKVEN